jgi:hypothetical protein
VYNRNCPYSNDKGLGLPPQVIQAAAETAATTVKAGYQNLNKVTTATGMDVAWKFPECGRKPIWPWGSSRREWERCVQGAVDKQRAHELEMAKIQGRNTNAKRNQSEENFYLKNKEWLLPAAGIAVGSVILYQILK